VTPAALAEFHAAQDHPGPPAGCPECTAQAKRQRADAKALRAARNHAAARAMDPRRSK
jgi:hypothetical protein